MPGIGIIGTGWGARIQVPAFRSVGLDVVALVGSHAGKTAQIAKELGVPWHGENWRDLIAHPQVDVVSIVTPPALHCEMTLAALEAGKHVLCEKPTALDAGEADMMLKAALARPDLFALIDHELRFLPAIRHARSLIAQGLIGTVRHAEVRSVNRSRSDLKRPWNWWSDSLQGGGVLGAIGSHQVDLLRYLIGDEVSAATGTTHTFVTERTDATGHVRPVTADDYMAATLRFVNGASAVIMATTVATHDEPNSVMIYGSTGALRFFDGTLWHNPGSGFVDVTPPPSRSFPDGIAGDFPEGTVYLGAALVAALAGDARALDPAATFADGLASQRVLDAIRAGAGM